MTTNRNVTRFFSILCLPILLAATAKPSTTTSSASAAPDSLVVLTPAEADSITAALVNYEVRLRLLQVDLDECREIAAVDSASAARALAAERMPWYERALRSPILWFCFGAYLGVSAGK